MSAGARPLAPQSPAGQPPVRAMLAERRFALYLVGQTTSGAGSALSSVAIVFAVLSISRSAGSVGLVLLAARLPGIAFALFGGLAADRLSAAWVAAGADGARTLTQLTAGTLLLTGTATVPLLAALACASGAASAVFGPAASTVMSSAAPGGHLRRANALLGMSMSVAQAGGLAASGAIVAIAGPGLALLIDGASFAVSTVALGLIARGGTGSPAPRRSGVLGGIRGGWRAVLSRRWLRVYGVQETVVNVLVLSPFFVLGPVIAKASLGGAPAWSGIAIGYVAGNLAASKLAFHWDPRRPILTAVLLSAALAPMLALLGLAAPLPAIIAAAFVAGAETTLTNTFLSAALAANVPAGVLGRATALLGIGSTVLVPAGMALAGVLATTFGPRTVMLAAAAIVVATTCVAVVCPATWTPLGLDRAGAVDAPDQAVR